MTAKTIITCPLCNSAAELFHKDAYRTYNQCTDCRLVFVPRKSHLCIQDEKSRYDLHQNSPEDSGYRSFLDKIRAPMIKLLQKGSRGLDFGCGPGPTLSIMFEELGYPMRIYDPLFVPDGSVLKKKYDFVTATEVVEHFRDPLQSLNLMWRCVKSGGYLGIMTKMVLDKNAFIKWHYITDDTHICFFSRKTFDWIGRQWNAEPVYSGNDVIFFHKNIQQSSVVDDDLGL